MPCFILACLLSSRVYLHDLFEMGFNYRVGENRFGPIDQLSVKLLSTLPVHEEGTQVCVGILEC